MYVVGSGFPLSSDSRTQAFSIFLPSSWHCFQGCFACLYHTGKEDERHSWRVNGPGLRRVCVISTHIPLTRTQSQGHNHSGSAGKCYCTVNLERKGIGLYSYLTYSRVIFNGILKKLIPLLDLAVMYWFSILLVVARSFVIFILILNSVLFFYSSSSFLKKMLNLLAFKLSFVVFKATDFPPK